MSATTQWTMTLALLAAAAAAAAVQELPDIEELPAAYGPLFAALTELLERTYPPARLPADWSARTARQRDRLSGVIDDPAFERLVAEVLESFPPPRPRLAAAGAMAFVPGLAVGWSADAAVVVAVDPATEAWRLGVRPGDQLLGDRGELAGVKASSVELALRSCGRITRRLRIARDRAAGAPWPPSARRPAPDVLLIRPADGDSTQVASLLAGLAPARRLVVDLRSSAGDLAGLHYLAGWLGLPASSGPVAMAWPAFAAGGVFAEPAVAWSGVAGAPELSATLSEHSAVRLAPTGPAAALGAEVVVLVDRATRGAAEAWAAVGRSAGWQALGEPSAGEPFVSRVFALGDGWSVELPAIALRAAALPAGGDAPPCW